MIEPAITVSTIATAVASNSGPAGRRRSAPHDLRLADSCAGATHLQRVGRGASMTSSSVADPSYKPRTKMLIPFVL